MRTLPKILLGPSLEARSNRRIRKLFAFYQCGFEILDLNQQTLIQQWKGVDLCQNLNYNFMNVQHKCLFHPANPIVKFCENKQCTLPLCLECEPIHIQEHHSQQSDAKVLRFNEATLKAANNMEDYIEGFKVFEKDIENKIENDREVAIRIIDEYYNTARKMINQVRQNVTKVTENLNKLNKGSIKALIFYYSGDIKLNKFDLEFEPLQIKIRNLLQKREQKVQVQRKKVESYQGSIASMEQQQRTRNNHMMSVQSIVQKHRTKDTRSGQNEDNVFTNIQEIKEQRNQSRTRKSIFDQNKRNSGINQNNPSYKQPAPRYNYIPHYEQKQTPQYEQKQGQQLRAPSMEVIPKFNYDVNYEYKNYERTVQQPEILSFQNRFLNKFSCSQQVEQNHLQTAKQFSRPETKYDEVFSKKLLKPEDLDFEKQNSNLGGMTIQATHTLTQRNRSMSQNNMNEKEVRKTTDYDLKRQVLSPDEIRRMLEKKIQERNRVLSIKKSDNYPMPAVEQRGRKGWETRDSIINQIYPETKY